MNDLFEHLRATDSYGSLSREQFNLVLNMLAGRYAASRVRELKPLISIDRVDNTVAARRGALKAALRIWPKHSGMAYGKGK